MRTDIYVHRDKDANWELAEKLGMSPDAARNFSYTCLEIKVTLDVDLQTGDSVIVAVNDKAKLL